MKKLFAVIAAIAILAFVAPEAESGKGGCTHWYDVNITPLEIYEDGSMLMHSTMTRKCKGQEETVVHCFITDEMGETYEEVPCP